MIIIAGLMISGTDNRILHFSGLVLGTAALYVLGTAWFCAEADSALAPALSTCVIPFIPGDLIKIIVTMLVGPVIHDRLEKAGLLK